MFDLVVCGGRIVIPGQGETYADIGITGGRIVALCDRIRSPSREVLDAEMKVILPGLVDPHVHLGNSLSFEEETTTETRAALLGGVTTVGVYLRRRDAYLAHLPSFRDAIETRSFVDAFFHLQIFTEEQREQIPACAADFGVRSFKFYMYGIPEVVQPVDDGFLLEGFRTVAGLGSGAVACVHAENAGLVERARKRLTAEQTDGTVADWERAHPAIAEALAVQTAGYLARIADVHLYIVHLSSEEGLVMARRVKEDSQRVTVETTSPYLGLSSDDRNGFLLKMVPPVRAPRHRNALWEGLRHGIIDVVGTDNTSRTRRTKQPEAGLHGARPGFAVLGTHLPVLLHFGYHDRGIPLDVLAEWACEIPARTFGLYPRKGTISVGADADLVIVDVDLEKEVQASALGGLSDFSPFEGKRLRGWPVATIKGGVLAVRDGVVSDVPRSGRYLPRYGEFSSTNVHATQPQA